MKEINFNSSVQIKLTAEGLKILKKKYNELLSTMTKESHEIAGEFELPDFDKDGYTKMQLWQVMNIFGEYMVVGNPNPPFESSIRISEEFIEEVDKNKEMIKRN